MAITIDGTNGLTTDSGALKLDGTTLTIDETNNRVGIGTASPLAPLTVKTATDRNLSVTSNGVGNLNDANSAWQETQFNGNPIIFGSGAFGTERMRIDSAGRVTMPYQPTFTAQYGPTTQTVSGTLTGLVALQNTGNHGNASTGVFTCPVTGDYYVSWSSLTQAGSGQEFSLMRNGSQVLRMWDDDTNWEHLAASAVIPCSANDTLNLYVNGRLIHAGQYTWFSVRLVG